MKEGAIIHLVLTRSCDLVEPHVPLRSARQKGVNSNATLYLDLPCKSQGQAPAPFHGYPKEAIRYFLPTFFNIHPTAKQTAVRRCRSRLSERREVVFGIRPENKKLQLQDSGGHGKGHPAALPCAAVVRRPADTMERCGKGRRTMERTACTGHHHGTAKRIAEIRI